VLVAAASVLLLVPEMVCVPLAEAVAAASVTATVPVIAVAASLGHATRMLRLARRVKAMLRWDASNSISSTLSARDHAKASSRRPANQLLVVASCSE
jgi:hypothetical protein